MAMGCDLIVMPFSRSRSMASRTWAFMSFDETVCVISSSRSARVDLPWSMWAMMQKFRVRDGGMRLKAGWSSSLSMAARARKRQAQPDLDVGPAADAAFRVVLVIDPGVRAEVRVELEQVRVDVRVEHGQGDRRGRHPGPGGAALEGRVVLGAGECRLGFIAGGDRRLLALERVLGVAVGVDELNSRRHLRPGDQD